MWHMRAFFVIAPPHSLCKWISLKKCAFRPRTQPPARPRAKSPRLHTAPPTVRCSRPSEAPPTRTKQPHRQITPHSHKIAAPSDQAHLPRRLYAAASLPRGTGQIRPCPFHSAFRSATRSADAPAHHRQTREAVVPPNHTSLAQKSRAVRPSPPAAPHVRRCPAESPTGHANALQNIF